MIEHKKYKLLEQGLKAITDGTINLLVERGLPGFGKSFMTKQFMDNNKVNYKYINTYSTPLAFYKLLYENRNRQVLVIDDVHVEDKKIIAILKGACNNLMKDRIVQWNSTSDILEKYHLPEEFELEANLILILNDDLPGFKPILNRSAFITFDFTFKEKLQIFKDVQEDAGIDVSVTDYVAVNCDNSTENLSIRTLVILSNLKTSDLNWQDFANEMLFQDPNISLLKELVAKSHDIKSACKEWCEETGHHRATFFRKKKLLDR